MKLTDKEIKKEMEKKYGPDWSQNDAAIIELANKYGDGRAKALCFSKIGGELSSISDNDMTELIELAAKKLTIKRTPPKS